MAEAVTTQGPSRAARTASMAVFAVFALVGVVFATWASRLPAIRDALEVTPGQMGVLLLVGSTGSLVALPLTGSVVHRFGTARTTRAGILLASLGMTGTAGAVAVGSTPLAGAALFLAMTGISTWDVAMNLQGTVVERHLGRAIMPRFHAGFSLGAVAGAATGALAAAAGVTVAWHLVVATTVSGAAALTLTRAYLPDGTMAAANTHDGTAPRARRRALTAWTEPRTLLIGLMVLAAALTEGSANDWLALAVVDDFAASQAAGALAFGIFVASMTLTRFAGTRLLDRYGRVPVLRLCAGLALVGLAAFGLAPSLPLALVAVMLWGCGAALGFPVGISAASDDPAHSAARVSVVSSIGYVAFLAGPPVLGMLADHVGYRNALLTIALPLVASLLLSPVAAPLTATADDPGSRLPPRAPRSQRSTVAGMAIREALSADLAAAMRRRDAGAVAALRAALSAVANAEAAPPPDPPDDALVGEHVAGAQPGVGVTEAARTELSEEQVRAIVAGERADLLQHAERLAQLGRTDEAEAARRGADALAHVGSDADLPGPGS